MSLLTSIASVQNLTPKPNPALGATPNPTETNPNPAATRSDSPSTAQAAGTAAAETTLAKSAIAPVLRSRDVNGSSAARSGAEGAPIQDAETLVKAAADSEAEAEQAAEAADAASKRRMERQEMLERIPVPVDAIPKLSSDVETLRSIEAEAEAEGEAA